MGIIERPFVLITYLIDSEVDDTYKWKKEMSLRVYKEIAEKLKPTHVPEWMQLRS